MTLDTAASVTIISSATLQKQLPDLKLQTSNILLKTYTGEPLKPQGEAQVTVCYKDQKVELPLMVEKGDVPHWSVKTDYRTLSFIGKKSNMLLPH